MTDQERQQSGGRRPSVGSVLIVFILKVFGGFLGLFHTNTKKTYSNMDPEGEKFSSAMLDRMKQDQRAEQ